ncbi:MAG: hypothetical protein ACYTEK_17010 [Planctomycetota bacterium]|jgi:hypothetical protein
MEESLLALNGFVQLVVGTIIFTLLWVVIHKTLKEITFFKDKAVEAIVATCVSLLSVIGMFQFLGITILLALYLFAGKLLGNHKPERSFLDAERKTEPAFQLDLDKGDRPAEEYLGETFQEEEMARDNGERLKPINRPLGKRMHESDFHRETKSNRIKQ